MAYMMLVLFVSFPVNLLCVSIDHVIMYQFCLMSFTCVISVWPFLDEDSAT